jgi:N-acetylneuraminate synthase/pseudaminic acid synthase
MSGNHGGNLDRAIEIVRGAAEAGADALKIQTYTADTITLNSDLPDFQLITGPWKSYKRLWNLYNTAHTPWEWHKTIFSEARRLGLEVFSSPFDESAVDLLESLGANAYKIASPEINHIPLLKRVARTGKPVILSTGLAQLTDINLALLTLKECGVQDIVLLKCTTAYPTPFEECNLRTIPDMNARFGVIAGLSDHTIGNAVAIAAVAIGAKVIEKHFASDVCEETVDSFFSNSQREFTQLVRDIRAVEKALGQVSYEISASAALNMSGMRSLYVSAPIRAGESINKTNIRCIRPSFGLHPIYFEQVLGREAKRDLAAGERLRLEDLK